MPSLSAYTPLEQLLFFQSLAANDTRPISFASISDLLRNNKFICENGAFDAHRLSPEALEDLYSNLMRDGGDSGSTQEPNGHHPEFSPGNPKKRKIATPRPDGLPDDGRRKAGFYPFLVPHLYAKYKELATAEIRQEEKRFRDIKREIERLEKEEREASREKPAPPAPTPVQNKPEFAPEPMDMGTNETGVKQTQSTEGRQPIPVKPATSVEAKTPPLESQPKSEPPPPTQTVPQPPPSEYKPPAQLVAQQPEAQKNLQLQSQPQTQALPQQSPLPPHPTPQQKPPVQPQPQSTTPQQGQTATPHSSQPQPLPQLPNGKPSSLLQQPSDAAQKAHVQDKTPHAQPPQQKQQAMPVAVAPSPVRGPASTPSQPPQASQLSNVSAPPTPSKAASAKATGKNSAPIVPVPTATPHGAPQASFQQWSLNQPQLSPPQPPSSSTPQLAPHIKPLQPPPTQQTPKVEKKTQPGPLPVAAPSTPQPLSRAVFQTPAPPVSGFATPSGPVQAFSSTGKPGLRPRLSINTPGSSTPWKQTPRLTLPHSPRSPDRPRPEDVSPISERAPSPFGSRAATPEEPEPPRRRGPGRGRKRATDPDQAGPRKKVEKATGLTGKKRGRSTHSSRSRGRSVLSRDEESETEAGEVKHEVPRSPAGINTAEPERGSTSQKGAPGSESRPRGRPKRKRAPSEALELESQPQSQPESSQLNRADSDQSAPFVLCARNFPRTGAPIMNDVLMHKYASLFSKPITDREVNGYRDFIYRPQDLKSIKSSISQGSKSVAAATEAANTPVADGESPVPASGTPSKNATLMLQKTEDVIPPKAIVNSAQLEKELIRMFANAVMFNSIPQRGFGPAFPLAADGGSGPRQVVSETDEGGIVNDAIEMFEDVEKAVTKWRAAERTDDLPSKSVLSLRRESASDPNMDSDDIRG
ncbi:hypothetical protein BDV06DRAFT_203652 [Aspergillus oleicola]